MCMAFVHIIINSPLDYSGLSKRVPAFCVSLLCPRCSPLLPCFKSPVVAYSVHNNACKQVDLTCLLMHLDSFDHCLLALGSPTFFPQRT